VLPIHDFDFNGLKKYYYILMASPVEQQLKNNQPPLGSQFKSYEFNKAINYYLLDPFQYQITKFDFDTPKINDPGCVTFSQNDFKNDPGLVYKGTNFEELLPSYTSTKKSVNDFPTQDYHRFLANQGYFNPNESIDNSDLWYYGAERNPGANIGLTGAGLNVQEVQHIIFPESQRGGTNSTNLAKYSWSNTQNNRDGSWEAENAHSINNNMNCQFFNYNSHYNKNYSVPVNSVYGFDSDYCRYIGINAPHTGSMPFN
jgi:hypothetical protein